MRPRFWAAAIVVDVFLLLAWAVYVPLSPVDGVALVLMALIAGLAVAAVREM